MMYSTHRHKRNGAPQRLSNRRDMGGSTLRNMGHVVVCWPVGRIGHSAGAFNPGIRQEERY